MFLTAVTAFAPCCIGDDCAEEIVLSNSDHRQQDEEKGNCSPLFVCGACAPAVLIVMPAVLFIPEVLNAPTPAGFISSRLSNYHALFFQPPRLSC